MTTRTSHERERSEYADFAQLYSEEEFRKRLAWLYQSWDSFNQRWFARRLAQPHSVLIDVDYAPPVGSGTFLSVFLRRIRACRTRCGETSRPHFGSVAKVQRSD